MFQLVIQKKNQVYIFSILLFLERFFSRAGLIDSISLYRFDITMICRENIENDTVPYNLQTRMIIIQYQTAKGAKRCKDLVKT